MPKPALPTVIDAVYLAEAREAGHWPPEGPVEVAIAGRSNVGKSTLLNRLAGRRALARVSKTPGRTRGIIFYDLSLRLPGTSERLALRLVDLPGYGYAQVSRDERKAWQRLVEGYVKARSSLRLFLILLDARRAPGEEEVQLVEWLRSERVPHHLVVTKTDKLRTAEHGAARGTARSAFGSDAPPVSLVSGETGEGVDALWAVLLAGVRDGGAKPL
ncbi:MAG TPA: ribosome biogenesis GTP-binding protein YihA/YsxC [Polyangia bacterium]|nr:ribosome biogenesis GTP-binding protein YihA/YsxC [Polyangia bacterium]